MEPTMAMIWFLATITGFMALMVIGTFMAKHTYDPHHVRKHRDWHFHRHV